MSQRKKCPVCGKVFIMKTKIQKVCSKSCSAKYNFILHPPKEMELEKTCLVCGKKFQLTRKQAWGNKRFCGTSCSAKWRQTLPSVQIASRSESKSQKISAKLKQAFINNPQLAKNLSIRMTLNNPTKNPETVKKIKATWAEFGHPLTRQRLKGGNGKPLPKAQRILWAALGPEWKTEYPIKTKQPIHSGYPTCYKADIALPKYKIWLEIDGWSHGLKGRWGLDKKKTKLLKTLGWKGLRFSNQEVENNLPHVLSIIYKFLDTHHIMQEES